MRLTGEDKRWFNEVPCNTTMVPPDPDMVDRVLEALMPIDRSVFDGKQEGWKFTACIEPLWAKPGEVSRQKYRYGAMLEPWGFHKDGAWSSFDGEGWTPSWRVKAKRYRERRWRWLVLDNLVAIEEGWVE